MNELYIRNKLKTFLLEDIGHIDIAAGSNPYRETARIMAEEAGVFCGGRLILPALELLTPQGAVEPTESSRYPDGRRFAAGDEISEFLAHAEVIRHGIRTILNLVAYLSGVASNTRRLVDLVSPYGTKLLDTRKTTPGLRAFEKYAVRMGGGYNHRYGRLDGILVKKEDIKLDGGMKQALDRAFREKSHLVSVEVEVETLEELEELANDGRVRHALLDNMDATMIREAVFLYGKQFTLEASGIDERDFCAIAATGVPYISTSALIRGARPVKMKMTIA